MKKPLLTTGKPMDNRVPAPYRPHDHRPTGLFGAIWKAPKPHSRPARPFGLDMMDEGTRLAIFCTPPGAARVAKGCALARTRVKALRFRKQAGRGSLRCARTTLPDFALVLTSCRSPRGKGSCARHEPDGLRKRGIAMKMIAAIIVAMLTTALGACAERPGEQVSVRATIADWIAPPGHQPNGGPVPTNPEAQQQAQVVQNAYQGDIARQQAGGQAVAVSQVTIVANGGQVNATVGGGFFPDTEWRPAAGVVSATVAECESVQVQIPRGDKPGGTLIYVTRVNGIVYAGPFPASGCNIPSNAQSFPGYGRFPLQVRGKVQGATIYISPWGSAPQVVYPGYR